MSLTLSYTSYSPNECYDASKSFNKFFDAPGDRDVSYSMETRLHNDVGSFENDQ